MPKKSKNSSKSKKKSGSSSSNNNNNSNSNSSYKNKNNNSSSHHGSGGGSSGPAKRLNLDSPIFQSLNFNDPMLPGNHRSSASSLFSHYHNNSSSSSSSYNRSSSDVGTYYQEYKETTQSCLQGLKTLVPKGGASSSGSGSNASSSSSSGSGSGSSSSNSNISFQTVNDIIRASDLVYENCLDMNSEFYACFLEEAKKAELEKKNHNNNQNNDKKGDQTKEPSSSSSSQKELELKFHSILSRTIFIPPKLISLLETSIQLRKDIMGKYLFQQATNKSKGKGGGNKGKGASSPSSSSSSDSDAHTHIISVLEYCLNTLKSCVKLTKDMKGLTAWLLIYKQMDTNAEEGEETTDNDNSTKPSSLEQQETNPSSPSPSSFNFNTIPTQESCKKYVDLLKQERQQNLKDTKPPVISDVTSKYTIEDDLIRGSDRLQACSLLYTMETLMGVVASNYRELKVKTSKSRTYSTNPSSSHHQHHNQSCDLQYLMYCAMVTNKCIQSVERAEAQLALDCPYLSSIYAVLGLVFLPDCITKFEEAIEENIEQYKRHLMDLQKQKQQNSSNNGGGGGNNGGGGGGRNKKKKKKKVILSVDRGIIVKGVGDIIEISSRPDFEIRYQQITAQLTKETGLPAQKVKDLTWEIKQKFQSSYEASLSYQWLDDHTYIGGDRPFLYTLLYLQAMFIRNAQSKSKPTCSDITCFGTYRWDEDLNPAHCFMGDMDEIYIGSILPELTEWCESRGECPSLKVVPPGFVLDKISGFTSQTLPIIHMLRKFIREGKTGSIGDSHHHDGHHGSYSRPVPCTLVFGMHAILTSIMEMQGSSDISSYATATEHAWKKLFRNLEKRVVEDEYNDLGRFVILACLPYPVGEESVRGGGRMAFLNPLMAGSYLLFANYVVAIGLGCNTIDFLGQLRLVLHLYNAFLQTNLIESDTNNNDTQEGEQENDKKSTGSSSSSTRPRLIMLEETMKVFSNTKAIWAFSNKLPSHGEFMKTSLLAWGYSPTSASQIIKYINSKYGEKGMPPDSHSGGGNRNSRNNRRKLKGIVQEEISNSYSFVMNEDFMYRTEADNRKKLHHDEPNNNNNNEGEGNSSSSSMTQQNNTHDVLETIMHISSTKSSMYNDLHNGILWTNWTEVGCICNDFIRALMKEFLSEFHPDDELTQNMVKYFSKFDAYAEYELYSKIICSKVLHPIDEDPQCEIGKKCAKFMQDFFENVEKSEYYFYDANNKNHSSKNQNSNSYYDNEDLMSVKFHQRQQQQYTTNNDEDVYEDDEDMMNSDGGNNLLPKKQRSLDDKHKQQQANNGGSSTQDNSNTSSNNHTNNDNDANDKEEESLITYHELRERALKILNDPKNKKKSLALQPPPPPLTAVPMTGANSTSTSSSSSYGHHVHEKTLSRKLSHEQHMMENDERITNTNYATVGVQQQEEPQPSPPFTAIHPQSTYEQLKDLNYEQMKQLAIEKGLDVSDCETKRDVVHLILTQKMEKTKPTRYRKLRDKTLKILERKDLKVKKKTQEEEEKEEKEEKEKETVLKDEEKVVKEQSNVQDNNVQTTSKPKANNTNNKANIHKAKEVKEDHPQQQHQQMKEFDMIVDMSNVQSMKDAIAVMSNPTMLSSRQQHDRMPSPPPGLDQSDDDTTSSSHSSTRSYYENNINNRKKKGTSNNTISTANTFETGEELRKSFSEKLKIHQSSSSSTAALKKVSPSSPPPSSSSSSSSTFLKHSHHRDSLVSTPRSNSFFIHEILTKMSVSELKNLAKEQGLDITKCVEKKEIVNMIVSPEEFFSNYREYRMEALEKLKKEKGLSGQQQHSHSQTQKQTMKQEYGSTFEEVFIESITTYEDLLEMRVSELKKLAKDYGTDISKCVEKKDIAQLLANELSSSNNNIDNSDNQEEDEIIINSFEEEHHHHYHQSHTYQELKEMSVSELKKLAKELDIDTRSCSTKKEIITEVNSGLGNGDPYIRGTTVFKSAPLGPNPLDPSLQYRTERGDGTRENPFQGYLVIDVVNNKDGEQEPAFRFVKPGKLTKEKQILTFRMVDSGERKLCHLTPLSDSSHSPKNKNKNNKKKKKEKYYRHIGSFSLRELRQIGWDGAMYQSDYVGTWVPYVDGYDSEEDFEFEDFDQRQQRRNGIIGLPQSDVGKFMLLPDLDGDQSLVQLSRI